MRLIITYEDQKPKVYEVEEESFTLGRSSKNDIQVDSEGISRQHLRIRQEAGNFFVTDLGSSNGSFINNERLLPNNETAWLTFLPIQLGHKISISLGEDGKAVPASQRSESTLELEKKNLGKLLDRPVRNMHPIRKKNSEVKKHDKEGVGISLVTIVTLLGVGALVYFHFQTRTVMEQTKESASNVKVQAPVMNQELLKQVGSAVLQPKCQGQVESFYCLHYKLDSKKNEGAIVLGDSLYVVMDIKNKILNLETDSEYPGFTEDEKRLYIMSSILLIGDAKIPLNGANIQNVYLADLINEQVAYVLKVPVATLLKFSTSDVKTIYSRLKAKDNSTYNRYILPGLEMASAR